MYRQILAVKHTLENNINTLLSPLWECALLPPSTTYAQVSNETSRGGDARQGGYSYTFAATTTHSTNCTFNCIVADHQDRTAVKVRVIIQVTRYT